MQLLTDQQVRQKIRRIAIEILERNLDEPEIILAGLNNNGVGFARLLLEELLPRVPDALDITLTRIQINPANPLAYTPLLEIPAESLEGKAVILVDDVANTGRTLFYAMRPLFDTLPKRVEVAVLVDRKHKYFPIHPDYIGMSLATTLLENIEVQLRDTAEMAVYLK